jgi:hypothetical protein
MDETITVKVALELTRDDARRIARFLNRALNDRAVATWAQDEIAQSLRQLAVEYP